MDTTANLDPKAFCVDCGAPINPGETRCWLCGFSEKKPAGGPAQIDPAGQPNPYASPALPNHPATQFSLTTLFLWTTLIAVIAGSATIAPGLAIALAVLSLPAAARTIGNVNRHKRETGEAATVRQKFTTFMASLSVVIAAGVAASAAFVATCVPLGFGALAASENGSGAWVPVLVFLVGAISIGVAGFVGFKILRATWWEPK